jgi:CHASE3 domain sensor protein
MKNLKKKIFLGLMIVVLVLFGAEIFSEFMLNHTYYKGMFSSWANWKIVI